MFFTPISFALRTLHEILGVKSHKKPLIKARGLKYIKQYHYKNKLSRSRCTPIRQLLLLVHTF